MSIKVVSGELKHLCTGQDMRWRANPQEFIEQFHLTAEDLIERLEPGVTWEKAIQVALKSRVPCLAHYVAPYNHWYLQFWSCAPISMPTIEKVSRFGFHQVITEHWLVKKLKI